MNKRHIISILIIIIITIVSTLWYMPATASRVEWKDYTESIKTAKQKKKNIFLNFYANWCGYCKKMEADTFSDKAVANYLQEYFIPIKINTDKQKRLAAAYGVRGLPLFWFVKPNMERIVNLPGYIPPGRFLNILKFIHTESYLKMNFDEFLKNQNKKSK